MQSTKPTSIGPYEIKEEIGSGGTATVYKATDTRTGVDVALKVLLPQVTTDESFLRRFIKEGRNMTRLQHENIVQIFDAGAIDGYHYIAMEYIPGGTLSQFISKQKRLLSISQTIEILSQIASALDFAHSEGFLHRDVKLSNMLMADDGRILLTDFGAAKQMISEHTMLTAPGQSIGTPSFMSPEQVTGERIDYRTDVYSLGVIAYKLFTGRMPYKGKTQPELLHKVAYEIPIAAEALNPELPPYIVSALKNVLSKDPKDRYESAGEFVSSMVAGEVWASQIPKASASTITEFATRSPKPSRSRMNRIMRATAAIVLSAAIVFSALTLIDGSPNRLLLLVQGDIAPRFENMTNFDTPATELAQYAEQITEQADDLVIETENSFGFSFEKPKLWLITAWLHVRNFVRADPLVRRVQKEGANIDISNITDLLQPESSADSVDAPPNTTIETDEAAGADQ